MPCLPRRCRKAATAKPENTCHRHSFQRYSLHGGSNGWHIDMCRVLYLAVVISCARSCMAKHIMLVGDEVFHGIAPHGIEDDVPYTVIAFRSGVDQRPERR